MVLGAGNVSSIAPMDVLYKLYMHHEVVILKMSPVNDYLGPIWRRCFRSFVDKGFLQLAYGGVEVGKYLAEHDLVGGTTFLRLNLAGQERLELSTPGFGDRCSSQLSYCPFSASGVDGVFSPNYTKSKFFVLPRAANAALTSGGGAAPT